MKEFANLFFKKSYKHPWAEFVNGLIRLETYPGTIHKCPECGGRLHFHLMLLERRSPEMAASQAWCEDCEADIAVDGIVPPPLWTEKATRIWNKYLKSTDTKRYDDK